MDTHDWPNDSERRSEARRNLLFPTTVMNAGGESLPVLVRDISANGLLVETEDGVTLDESFALELPLAGKVTVHVIWQGEKLAGCRLDDQLSQATIDAVRDDGAAAHEADEGEEPPQADIIPPQRTTVRSLASRLKELRLAADMTRAELAERSGISTPSIWAWETGRTVPRLGSLETLARGLGVPVSELQIGAGFDRGDGAPSGTGNFDLRGHRLADVVAATREQIATLAGVPADRVTITIKL